MRYFRGDSAGARAACARALALDPAQPFAPNHLRALELAGPAGRDLALEGLSVYTGQFSGSMRARLHARLGNRDSAMANVAAAVADRVLVAPFMRPDPLFDPYRSDPRWVAAMRAMGLGP